MDIQEFAGKIAEATKNMSDAERASLMKVFASVSDDIAQVPAGAPVTADTDDGEKLPYYSSIAAATSEVDEDGVPLGPTERLVKLKENFLKQVPAISTYRARAVTKITKENPGLPKIELRAKCFRYCCETAPLVIQDNELIVGNPTGGPRVGAFAPDIAWRWMVDEIDTIGERPQDPFYISEEDKRIMREELFPFWEGKSVDEYCETQYREAGVWALSGESMVSDCSYHAINGGGDTGEQKLASAASQLLV